MQLKKVSRKQSEADAGDMSHYDPNLGKTPIKPMKSAKRRVMKRKMLETAAKHLGY